MLETVERYADNTPDDQLPPGWHVSAATAAGTPNQPGRTSALLLQHGSATVRWYAPVGSDPQQPHDQDEVYIVHSGHGTFLNGAIRQPFGPGDMLFVPAGRVHRFEDFSDDFATWVLFWGPSGGEAPGGDGSAD